jgi:3-dehydroquinate synthase
MKIIKVNLKSNPYKIYIGYQIAKKLARYLNNLDLGNFAIIITSPNIRRRYSNLIKKSFGRVDYRIVEVAEGEEAKSIKWFLKAIDEIVKYDSWGRRIFIVCLGGGTIGDLGGFIASVYKRGTPYIQLPTTFLSQIDASIGGKTAIDLKAAKNILGAFYQPRAVFIDPFFLASLGVKQMREGLAEAVKYALIQDRSFFNFLKSNYKKINKFEPHILLKIIYICAQIKAKIVESDEKEKKGIRTLLNFGHTLAHALEASGQYKNLSHGEAVSLGMLYATQLSCSLGLCEAREFEEIYCLFKLLKLPTEISFDYLSVYKAMGYDKKFICGKARLVLLRRIGMAVVRQAITTEKILKTLQIFTRA